MSVTDPIPVPPAPLTRPPTTVLAPSPRTPSFVLGAASRSYRHQYATIYFARLQLMRRPVLARARRRWKGVADGRDPQFVLRMLDMEKGQLCFIIGTVYMDMPLKPNVLEDIARDHSIPAPPPRPKYHSPSDQVTLEDESGRIVLVGDRVRAARLVTGVVLAALGVETSGGEFEVVDVCSAGMAPQPGADLSWGTQSSQADAGDKMDVDEISAGRPVPGQEEDEWIAFVSGLEVGAHSPADAQIQMLVEYLTGEAGGPDDQAVAARITRLIVAGNSLAPMLNINGKIDEEEKVERKARRYGHDPAHFSPHPTLTLSGYLTDIARAMPVHILPGATDPAGTLLPQQPFPRSMFGGAAAFASFACETNPTYIRVGPSNSDASPSPDTAKGKQKASASTSKPSDATTPSSSTPQRTLLVSSGQPVDDMYKYLPTPPSTRLSIAASSLKWRHLAPTAPDTLWCHPYSATDPFIITETPDVYVVGCQPAFGTRVVHESGWGPRRKQEAENGEGMVEDEVMDLDGEMDEEGDENLGMEGEGGERKCRIILVPGFRETGILVLLNMRTLAVRTVQFAVEGMSAGGGET